MAMKIVAMAAAMLVAAPAAAQITVDGARDAAYGPPQSSVIYNPALASDGYSDANGPYGEATGYAIYLTSDANAVYGYLQTTLPGGTGAGSFAHLYFDLDPANHNGADLGFDITNGRAFIPGVSGYSAGSAASPLAGLAYAFGGDGADIEFSIADSLFTAPIAGLGYRAGQQFATTGSTVVLDVAQAFNDAFAGGDINGDSRLGIATIGGVPAAAAVPEPASWALMIAGFGLAGAAMRRRRTAGAVA